MNDFQSLKSSAVRYWERRRVFYNLALVLPTILGYIGADPGIVPNYPHMGTGGVIRLLILGVLGANICYSFAYALEFLFGGVEPVARWPRWGRVLAFVLGTLLGMVLAFRGGRAISFMEYQPQ